MSSFGTPGGELAELSTTAGTLEGRRIGAGDTSDRANLLPAPLEPAAPENPPPER
jgi:hypothetical protein